jgi:ornithine cyclodeaminase/alanine dehydrogenase-like protein (mu-crystallin family)
MRVIDADELRRLLPMAAAIDALESAFRTGDPSATPMRSNLDTPVGSMLVMPASGPEGLGVKLVTLTPDNPERGFPFVNAVYVLFDGVAQLPEAVIDGAALTALRTAAVSGLATRLSANDGARSLVIFGAGVQGAAHLEAMLSVRPIERVRVVSRTTEPADVLVEAARAFGVADAALGDPGDVDDSDIVCTCTTATSPLFDGRRLSPGAHVNAVGTHVPTARELDTETIRRANIVVETREAALTEAGELVIAMSEGAIDKTHVVADLQELASGTVVRTSHDDVTVFKSVGIAFEDLVVARAVVDAT